MLVSSELLIITGNINYQEQTVSTLDALLRCSHLDGCTRDWLSTKAARFSTSS
jgi:hypothetical protein